MSFFIGLMSCCYLWTDCAPMLTLNSQIPAGVIAPILAVSVNQKVQITIQLNVIFNAEG